MPTNNVLSRVTTLPRTAQDTFLIILALAGLKWNLRMTLSKSIVALAELPILVHFLVVFGSVK